MSWACPQREGSHSETLWSSVRGWLQSSVKGDFSCKYIHDLYIVTRFRIIIITNCRIIIGSPKCNGFCAAWNLIVISWPSKTHDCIYIMHSPLCMHWHCTLHCTEYCGWGDVEISSIIIVSRYTALIVKRSLEEEMHYSPLRMMPCKPSKQLPEWAQINHRHQDILHSELLTWLPLILCDSHLASGGVTIH